MTLNSFFLFEYKQLK